MKEIRNRRDQTDAIDLVDQCADKIEFLIEFFNTGSPDSDKFVISEKGRTGLAFILEDLIEELDLIVEKMSAEPKEKS